MTAGTGFTLFIPVYNEEALLVPNVNRLVSFLGDTGIPFEILIGSNGSTDGSLNLLKQLSLKHGAVRYFGLPQKGVGAAFREGVLRARYDRIITVDMDLSIHLDFIPHAYRLLDRYDMVIGSKITGSQRRSWVRKAASGAFIVLARLMLNIYFHDYSIAAKAYRRETAQRYLPFLDDKTFYVVQMVYRAKKAQGGARGLRGFEKQPVQPDP